jgi:hypothetical protein
VDEVAELAGRLGGQDLGRAGAVFAAGRNPGR